MTTANYISAAQDKDSNIITDELGINEQEELYSSEQWRQAGRRSVPVLEDADRDNIEEGIQLTEMEQAVRKMKPGKVRGPDGFHWHCSLILLPFLCKAYDESLPPTMRQAISQQG